jgi:hypothetical protein
MLNFKKLNQASLRVVSCKQRKMVLINTNDDIGTEITDYFSDIF